MIILRPDIPAWGMKDKRASDRLAPDRLVSGRLPAPDKPVSGRLPAPDKPVWADIQLPGPRKRAEQSRSTVRITIWIFPIEQPLMMFDVTTFMLELILHLILELSNWWMLSYLLGFIYWFSSSTQWFTPLQRGGPSNPCWYSPVVTHRPEFHWSFHLFFSYRQVQLIRSSCLLQ